MKPIAMNLKSYLKENWGAPFVIAFTLLLIASAVELSIGLSGTANSIAIYAFYFLVAGVALQIASYVKYGEGKPEAAGEPVKPEPAREPVKPEPVPKQPWLRGRRRILAVTGVALLVTCAVGGVAYYYATGGPTGPYTLTLVSSPAPGYGVFNLYVDGVTVSLTQSNQIATLSLPSGTHTVDAGNYGAVVTGTSGCPADEYKFSSWSDGGAQNHTIHLTRDTTLTATYTLYKTIC
jgi:hypothetical protein